MAVIIPTEPMVLFLFWYPLPESVTVILETTLFAANDLINCLPTPKEVKSIWWVDVLASDSQSILHTSSVRIRVVI